MNRAVVRDLLAEIGGLLDRGLATPLGQAGRLHQGFLWLMDDEDLSDTFSRTIGHPGSGFGGYYNDERPSTRETCFAQWMRYSGNPVAPPCLEGMR